MISIGLIESREWWVAPLPVVGCPSTCQTSWNGRCWRHLLLLGCCTLDMENCLSVDCRLHFADICLPVADLLLLRVPTLSGVSIHFPVASRLVCTNAVNSANRIESVCQHACTLSAASCWSTLARLQQPMDGQRLDAAWPAFLG